MPDGLKFDPADITIPKGGIVTWINTSDLPHTATDDPSKASNPANAALPSGAEPWDSGNVDPASTSASRMRQLGWSAPSRSRHSREATAAPQPRQGKGSGHAQQSSTWCVFLGFWRSLTM
jgi:hypothetical protein